MEHETIKITFYTSRLNIENNNTKHELIYLIISYRCL